LNSRSPSYEAAC